MAWIAPTIAAGGSIVGGLAGGDGSKDPVADIDEIYGRNRGDWVRDWAKQYVGMDPIEYYPGSTVARLNPRQTEAWDRMTNFGRTNPIAGLQEQQGRMGLMGQGMGMGYLADMYQRGPNQFQYDQGTFDTSMASLMPAMQGTYNDMTRDIDRNLDFSTLPGIDMNFAMSGGTGASGRDLQSAFATGMANDRKADIGSQLYQNAVNQSQNAAMNAGQWNLDAAQRGDQAFLSGANQLAATGLPGFGDAWQTNVGNFGLMDQAGGNYFGYDQSLINADMDRFNFGQNQVRNYLRDNLNYLHQMQGMGVGQPVMSGATPGMNPITGAIQGGLGALGAYNMYQQGQTPFTPDYNTGTADFPAINYGMYGN